jgi:hypothetical protein
MGGSVSDKYVAGLGAAGGGSVYSIGAIAPGIVGHDIGGDCAPLGFGGRWFEWWIGQRGKHLKSM